MSILNPIPQSEIGTKYSHYGWFAGLVPIYIGDIDSEGPVVIERNWVPEWYFWAVDALFGLFCFICSSLNPQFVPSFPILISGKVQT